MYRDLELTELRQNQSSKADHEEDAINNICQRLTLIIRAGSLKELFVFPPASADARSNGRAFCDKVKTRCKFKVKTLLHAAS